MHGVGKCVLNFFAQFSAISIFSFVIIFLGFKNSNFGKNSAQKLIPHFAQFRKLAKFRVQVRIPKYWFFRV